MRFNLKSGLASQKKLSASAVDFPRINESYTGRYTCFVFHVSGYADEADMFRCVKIIKFSLDIESVYLFLSPKIKCYILKTAFI